jgi:hypothetical protein
MTQSPVAPDDRFSKPWHGIPRSEIPWFPTVGPTSASAVAPA